MSKNNFRGIRQLAAPTDHPLLTIPIVEESHM